MNNTNANTNWAGVQINQSTNFHDLLQFDAKKRSEAKSTKFWKRYTKAANWQTSIISIILGLGVAALIIISHHNVKPYIRIVTAIGLKNVAVWGWLMYGFFQITQLGTTLLLSSEALIYKLVIFVSKLPTSAELDPAVYGESLIKTYRQVTNKYRNLIYQVSLIRLGSYLVDSVFVLWHTPIVKGSSISAIIDAGAWHLIDWYALLSIPAVVGGVELLFWILRKYTALGRIFSVSLVDLANVTPDSNVQKPKPNLRNK